MLWNRLLLAASLLSSAFAAVYVKSRAASAEEAIPNFAIGNYDESDTSAVGENEEELISNRAIGYYDNDETSDVKPVAEDE